MTKNLFLMVVTCLVFANTASAEKFVMKKTKSVYVSEDSSNQESNLIDMNFPEPTPLKDVTRWVSGKLSKNFIIPPDAKEKIQIVAEKPVSAAEAYQLYVSAVGLAGYEVRDEGRVVRLVRLD